MTVPATQRSRRLDLERRLSQTCERYFILIAACAAAVFYVAVLAAAARRVFWFDEINTVLLARLPLNRLWQALAAGADTNPPLFYIPVGWCERFLGESQLACRVPSIAFFSLAMVSMYAIAKPYTNRLYALAAAFLLFMTNAGSYAVEARSYAVTIACGAAALFCWREAANFRHRRACLIGLACSLAIAISSHYAAAILFMAIAAGELVRIIRRRAIDWPVLAALAIAAAPLWFFRPLVAAVHIYLPNFWAKPTVLSSLLELGHFMAPEYGLAYLIVAAIALTGLMWGRANGVQHRAVETPPLYELTAWGVIFCTPLIGFLQGKLLTGGYNVRYAMPMSIAIALFVAIACFRIARGTALAGIALLLFGLACCVDLMRFQANRRVDGVAALPWLASQPNLSGPVVVGDPLMFSAMEYYARPRLHDRLMYVSSPQWAVHYLGTDSPDLNLRQLQPFAPIRVEDYDAFIRRNEPFLLVTGRYTWMILKLNDDRVPIQQLSCWESVCLYRVR